MSTAQPQAVLLGSMEDIKKVRKLVKIFLGNQTYPGSRRMLNPEKNKKKPKTSKQKETTNTNPRGWMPNQSTEIESIFPSCEDNLTMISQKLGPSVLNLRVLTKAHLGTLSLIQNDVVWLNHGGRSDWKNITVPSSLKVYDRSVSFMWIFLLQADVELFQHLSVLLLALIGFCAPTCCFPALYLQENALLVRADMSFIFQTPCYYKKYQIQKWTDNPR